MSVQESAPKQPVSFSDDSLYEDEKSLVMTEVSGMSYWSEEVSDGAVALPIQMVDMNDPSNQTEEYLEQMRLQDEAQLQEKRRNEMEWRQRAAEKKLEMERAAEKLEMERAAEMKEEVRKERKTGFLSWLMAIGVLLMAYIAATLEGLTRAIACLGVVGVTGVIAMSIMVESAPTERLMPCHE